MCSLFTSEHDFAHRSDFFYPPTTFTFTFFLYIQTLSITIVTKSPGGKKYICNIMLSPILGFFSPAPTPPAVELYGVFTVERETYRYLRGKN